MEKLMNALMLSALTVVGLFLSIIFGMSVLQKVDINAFNQASEVLNKVLGVDESNVQ